MCGRSTLTTDIETTSKRYQVELFETARENWNQIAQYNIAPTHHHPILSNEQPSTWQFFRWGLIPHWAKSAAVGAKMINARIESVLEKPAFRQAIRQRRCLVPLDGFYEWQTQGSQKRPYRIGLKNGELFSVAGIWEKWQNPQGHTIHSFSLLTQPPNSLLAPIHNRMPAILHPEQERLWLDRSLSTESALQLISPYPSELMHAYPVSTRVNKVGFNDPILIKEQEGDMGIQGSLF